MNRIETEETGLANGHPAVIVTGKIAQGTVCPANGLLMLDETSGAFAVYDFAPEAGDSGPAYAALETISATATNAKVLLHGTFNADMAVKADGSALTAAELAALQKRSQIFFI
jgi:hypothetical protein